MEEPPSMSYMVASSVTIGLIFVGVSVVVIRYILNVFSGKPDNDEMEKQNNEQLAESTDKKQKEIIQRKVKKKTRVVKQDFKHVLLYSTLKCVKGEVCDIDYSNNGKFLATCSTEKGDSCSSDSSSSKSASNQSSAASTPKMKPTLSRRQRKNRKEKEVFIQSSPFLDVDLPGLHWAKMGGSERSLSSALLNYCLTSADRFAHGYPTEIVDCPGMAIVYSPPRQYQPARGRPKTRLDVNASEYIPKTQRDSAYASSESGSSGTSSGNSSDSDEYADKENQKQVFLTTHPCFPMPVICNTYPKSIPFEMINYSVKLMGHYADFCNRNCMRCGQNFVTDKNNELVNKEKCIYHPGKKRFRGVLKSNEHNGEVKAHHVWNCCEKPIDAKGCCAYKQHVWSGTSDGYNPPLGHFVKTKPVRVPNKNNSYGVYALDCEMSFTKNGLELTKVTVVNMTGKVVYDTYVQPENEIIDYNTRFSGVTAKHLSGKGVKTLKEVQNDLMGFINSETIIVGHALENDFRALKIIHEKVVDTAFLYPHKGGYPFKQSLKTLSMRHLNLEIQKGTNGHNAHEDAWAAMQLAIHRAMADLPCNYYHY